MAQPEAIAARLRRIKSDGLQGPVTLELYPTLTCNLSCRFCDTTDRHRPPVEELTTARLLALVDEAAALGVARVMVLGGGEPLVRRDATAAVMRRIKEHGMEGILTTNATLFTPELQAQLLETQWDEVHISLDGATPQVHDKLRGQAGAFRKSVQAACALSVARRRSEQAHPRVAVHFVITNENYRDLTEMVELAHAIGAFRLDVDALIAYRPEQLALRLSPQQAAEVPDLAARALDRADALGIATTLARYCEPSALDRGNTAVPIPDGEGLKGAPCLKAWHHLVIQADGMSSPCCVLAGEGGSARDTSIDQLWRTDAFLNRVREGMLAKAPLPRCRECSWNILSHEAAIREQL